MYQRILVPVDGSDTSNKGLDEAVKLAKLTGAVIRLVHVVDSLSLAIGVEPFGAYSSDVVEAMRAAGNKILENGKSRVQASGIPVDCVLFDDLSSGVSDCVIDQAKAWNADLLVVGTHGRRGVGRLLMGSDAERIARTAPVPTLLVRAQEPH